MRWLIVIAAVGCTGGTSGMPDGGQPLVDTGTEADAGTVDTGPPDTGVPPTSMLPASITCDPATSPPTCRVSEGVYQESMAFAADNFFELSGRVTIRAPAVLTIGPGTEVRALDGSMLIIEQGARIEAHGLAEAPIQFSSRNTWIGLLINGRAPTNCPACTNDDFGAYGGDDPQDGSGTLRFVTIELAGMQYAPGENIGGLELRGVGRGTEIDYLQVDRAVDDGLGILGGTVDLRHVLITDPGDDGIDWGSGWTGRGQFIAVRASQLSDNGLEGDNGMPGAMPRSRPVLSNVTVYGTDSSVTAVGARLKEGTALHLTSAVFAGFDEACLQMEDLETFDVAWDGVGRATGQTIIERSIFWCPNAASTFLDFYPDFDPWSVATFVLDELPGNSEEDPLIDDRMLPGAGSPTTSGGFPPGDSFFRNASYQGAFESNGDWTDGWRRP